MRNVCCLIATALIVCLTSAAPVFAKSKTTYYDLQGLTNKTLSMTTVKVSWKKHRVDKYVIYKVYWKGEKEKHKKLKTVSGKKKSAVLKLRRNKEIEILVKGIKKKKHGKKVVYEGRTDACSGLSRPEWYVNDFSGDDYHSPTEINLTFAPWDAPYNEKSEGGGLKPTGYEVYRKEVGAKKYTLVKKVNLKKANLKYAFRWKDTSVKAGQYYYYKVRSYRKFGKKVYRSKMSQPCCMGATYYEGQFKVLSEMDGSTMTLQLISDPLNGDLCADLDEERGFATERQDMCYVAESYSLDGIKWYPIGNRTHSVWVEPGKGFWIRLEEKQDSEQYQRYREMKWVNSFTLNCEYSGYFDAVLSIYVDEGRAISSV